MLYDGALRNVDRALEEMGNQHRRYDSVSNHVIRAQDIITELMVSLDFDRGEVIARNLFGLYVYMNRRLLEGNIQKDVAPLQEVRTMLLELRGAWAEVAEKKGADLPERAGGGGVNIAG